MSNPTVKVSVTPTDTKNVAANITLAQLVDLLGECKDSGQKVADMNRQLNGIEDRLTAIEKKISLPHPPVPPPGCTSEVPSKDLQELKKQFASLQEEVESLRADREATMKEMFEVGTGSDTMRTTLQSAVSTLVAVAIKALQLFNTQIGGVQGVSNDKK